MLNKGAETLPAKDAQAFKQLAKFHDAKNFKKGLKQAEKLLQTYPDHPETFSMKALFELALGQQNKSLQTAKVGLMKSKMKSMFCWHTMGTIYKQKRDYLQASKCFQNAVRFEPDNMQILKQTACLQIQIRDHASHIATRFAILKQKPNMIQNWAAFTLAYHLKGDFEGLFKSLVSFDNLIKTLQVKPIQMSHYYIYRVIAFRDSQKFDLMYEQLQKNKELIKDELMWLELAVKCCIKLNKKQEAANNIDILLKKLPQNAEYMKRYSQIHDFGTNPRALYKKIHEVYQSKIARILQLSQIKEQQQFKQNFIKLIKPYFKKNLVSLFAQIQVIYESGKEKWIGQIFEQFQKSLQKGFYPDNDQAISPSQYLWSLYMLAQHYALNFNTLAKSHQYISKAIKHTNTVSEFYIVKAEIQYKLHNNFESLKTINQARKTDLADRYMNNICCRYLMNCQKPLLAQQTLRLFMRDEASVYELQNQWYIIEAGKSFLKQRNFQAGLRHMNFINKQFLDMLANQFDFHIYCIRKWTLREYTELICFNDNIYQNKKYVDAAAWAIKYLAQYSEKIKSDQANKVVQTVNQQTAAQKKKKKKKKNQNEVQELTPVQTFRKKIDFWGKDYAQTIKKSPLDEAFVYAKNVASAKYINKKNRKQNKLFGKAYFQCINVFMAFDKPLLVLRCLKKLKKTDYNEFDIKLMTLKVLAYFQKYLANEKGAELSKLIITEYINESLQGKNSKDLHKDLVDQWKNSSHHLAQLKNEEINLIIQNQHNRSSIITLYKKSLQSLIQKPQLSNDNTQQIFFLTHKLQFYGQFTNDYKEKLNKKLQGKTTYYTNWVEDIDKMPESTWTMWWLSEYDIQRQELEKQKI